MRLQPIRVHEQKIRAFHAVQFGTELHIPCLLHAFSVSIRRFK